MYVMASFLKPGNELMLYLFIRKMRRTLRKINVSSLSFKFFGKISEKLMYESLYSHLEKENLLNPDQSGFRPGDSKFSQLLSITHSIFEAFDCNPTLEVRSVYLNIFKAFDRVWHKGLVYKLRR